MIPVPGHSQFSVAQRDHQIGKSRFAQTSATAFAQRCADVTAEFLSACTNVPAHRRSWNSICDLGHLGRFEQVFRTPMQIQEQHFGIQFNVVASPSGNNQSLSHARIGRKRPIGATSGRDRNDHEIRVLADEQVSRRLPRGALNCGDG